MAQTIQIKRSSSTSAPGSLLEGEFAWVDHGTGGAAGKLYIGDAAAGAVTDISGSSYLKVLSGSMTGSATAPTQSPGDNSTRIATTAYVDAAILTEDTVLEMGDTDIRDIVASSYAGESQVDINASGISEFAVAGEADDDVDFTTESNYIQQSWDEVIVGANAVFTNGSSTVTTAGVFPTNCANGRISQDGTNWYDITTRDSATQLTLSSNFGQSTVTGTFDIRMTEFDSGVVKLSSVTVLGTEAIDRNYDTATPNHSYVFGTTAQPSLAMCFSAGATGLLSKVECRMMQSVGTAPGTFTVSLYPLVGGVNTVPDDSGTALATITGLDRTGISTDADPVNGTFKTFTFASPATVTSGSFYAVVVTQDTPNDSNYFRITSYGGETHSSDYAYYQSGAWTADSSAYQLQYETYITPQTITSVASEYVSVVTSESHNPNTDGWLDLNSASITETTDSNSNAHYWLGFDPASSYGANTEVKINIDGLDGSTNEYRTIAKNNAGTWEYNSSVPVAGVTAAAGGADLANTLLHFGFEGSTDADVSEETFGNVQYWTNHGGQGNLGGSGAYGTGAQGTSQGLKISNGHSIDYLFSGSPGTLGWQSGTAWTFECWVDKKNNGFPVYTLLYQRNNSTGAEWRIDVGPSGVSTVYLRDAAGNSTTMGVDGYHSTGSGFCHWAICYDPNGGITSASGNGSNGKFQIYRNGTPQHTVAYNGSSYTVNGTFPANALADVDGSPLQIGNRQTTIQGVTWGTSNYNGFGSGGNFNGAINVIDEVRLSNVVRYPNSFTVSSSPYNFSPATAGVTQVEYSDYTGTSATTNDMLHAVSEAVSTVSANRMTETQAEAISDADFELTGGFTAGTTSSVFRGTTLYSTDDESNPSVDQYSLNFTGELGDNMFGRVDANQSIGQIFQSTSDDELHSAKMFIKTIGSPTDNVVLKLYSVTGSVGQELPNALLATSDAVAASAMSSSYAEHTFTFSTTVNMVDGTKYAIVCDRSGSDSNTNYYRAQGQDTDVYNSGHLVELDSSWTATVLKDLSLQVFGSVLQSVGTGRILIYDGVDSWDDKDVSGVITMTKEGVTSLTSASIVDVDISVSAAIANAKLANSTISGKALGANLDSLTLGAGFGAGTYNGSTAVTANVDGILEDLDTLGAAASDGQFIVATGTGAFAYESGNTARTSLGLGSSDAPTFTGMDASSTAITNVGLPINAQELATLAYVASVEYGMDFKDSVTAATTADMSATYANGTAGVGATLTGSAALGTIDGVTIVAGDRLLIKNQSTASENGIYVATTITDPFVLTRSVDADQDSEFTAGAFVFVEQGTIAADNAYINISDGDITFGTTSINWTPFTGAGMITAGTGLSKSGNTLSIDTSYVGQASITTLGTIASGVWESTRVGATYGGTGTDSSSETGIPQIVNGTWTFPSTVAPVYGGLGIDTSGSTGVGSVSGGTWSISSILSNTLGGTGTDSSSETGIPQVVGGTWTYPSEVLPLYGGTGLDTSSSTGVVSVSGGTWSVGTSVPVTQGGSGNTSMTTGDMMMASDTEEMTMLAAGSAGMVMQTSDAIMPTWNAIDGQIMSSMMDSVSITSSGVNTKIGTAGDSPEKVGQTITTTDTGTLNYAKFKLKRIGNPSDTYVAKVAAVTTTSGTIHNNLSSNTNASGSGVYEGCIFAGGAYQAYSSNFTPSSDTAISTIAFEVKADSPSSTQEYTLEIYPTSSGKPVRTNGNNFSGSGVSGFNSGRGASLVASNTYNTGGLSSTSWSTVTATFSTSYTLTSGTEYAVVFCPVGSSSGSRVYFRTQAGTNSEAWGYDGGWTTGSYSPTLEIGMNISSSITGPGSALATSGARNASDVSRAYQMMEFTFSGANKITLANATKYAFYLERTGTADTSNILATDTQSSSSYAGGDAISHDGTSWSTHTDREHNLQVWTDDV